VHHLPSLFQREHFKAQRVPTGQVRSSQFRLPFHPLETSDGHHHRHTTKPSQKMATMLLREVPYAFSLEKTFPTPEQSLKTGTYSSLPCLEQSSRIMQVFTSMFGLLQVQLVLQTFLSRYGYTVVVNKVAESRIPYMMAATSQHTTLC
jgi:hypothetical protein